MLEWPRSRRLVTTMKTVLRIFSPHYCMGQGIYQLASTGGNANQSGYNPWAQEASFQPPQQSQAQRANGAASVKGWAGRADKLTIAAGDWSLYTINARPGVRLLCIHTRCRGSVRETSTPGLFLPACTPAPVLHSRFRGYAQLVFTATPATCVPCFQSTANLLPQAALWAALQSRVHSRPPSDDAEDGEESPPPSSGQDLAQERQHAQAASEDSASDYQVSHTKHVSHHHYICADRAGALTGCGALSLCSLS